MRAGELRNRVTLQKPVYSRDAFNEETLSYVDVASVWAAVEWGNGRRYVEANQLNSEVQGVIRIRYRSDVLAGWRIKYGSRNIEILAVSDFQERGAEMRLNCREALD